MVLTKQNYFSRRANKEFMSVSQFKSFEKCEACAMAELKGKYTREPSTALLVGSYVDAFYEGTLDTFRAEHPEIFKKDGSLKAEYVQADAIIERTMKDRLFQKHMSGRKQVIMVGVICGVRIKIKIDSLRDNAIDDLKIMRDMNKIYVEDKGGFVPFFEAWEYDLQGAVYQEVVRQNIGKRLPFFLDVATKEEFPDIEIIQIDQQSLDISLDYFREKVTDYDAIKKGIIKPERCGKCEYCRRSKVLKGPINSQEFYL